MKLKSVGLICLIFFLNLFCLGFPGCNYPGDYRKTKLLVSVDLSQIPSVKRNKIEKLELTVSGVLPNAQISLPLKKTGVDVNPQQSLEQEVGPIEESGFVYARVAARVGFQDLASEIKKIEFGANEGREEVSFSLKIIPSPNGCEILQTQTPTLADLQVGSFDVLWNASNKEYFLVYVSKTLNRLFAVTLDEAGGLKQLPRQIDGDLSFSGIPALPVLVQDENGYIAAWESAVNGLGQKKIVIRRLSELGVAQANVRFFGAGEAVEVRPALALSNGILMAGWGERSGTTDQLKVAAFDAATLSLVVNPKLLGPSSYAASYLGLAERTGGGFAALWSYKSVSTAPYNLSFAFIDASLNVVSAKTLRDDVGDAVLGRLLKIGTGYLASWEDNRFIQYDAEQVAMAWISESGEISDEFFNVDPAFNESANWPNMAMTPANGGALVFYQYRGLTEGAQVYLTRLDSTGAALGAGDVQLSQNFTGETGARYSDIVATGDVKVDNQTADGYGVFWLEEPNEGEAASRLMFARVGCVR